MNHPRLDSGTRLLAALPSAVGADNLRDIQVLFQRASDSSLDYAVRVDLKGGAAHLFPQIPGIIQRILVDACNENGWVIPFPQVRVHQG